MGFFDFLKKDVPSDTSYPSRDTYDTSGVSGASNSGTVELLDLSKGDILDLTKFSGMLERQARASAGWGLNKFGRNYDLDLCAYLVGKNRLYDTVYYGDKTSTGIYLDGDDLVGGGGGDNENIYVTLKRIPKDVDTIYFAVVIFEAASRRQVFENVQNAYVRLVDDNNCEICRFTMTDGGGDNTALLAAKLFRNGDNWLFQAIGEYSKDTISSLGRKVLGK